MARNFGLPQIIPLEERKHRKAETERRGRSEKGAVTREEYVKANSVSRTKPWKVLGIRRTKFFELKAAGMLPELEAM